MNQSMFWLKILSLDGIGSKTMHEAIIIPSISEEELLIFSQMVLPPNFPFWSN